MFSTDTVYQVTDLTAAKNFFVAFLGMVITDPSSSDVVLTLQVAPIPSSVQPVFGVGMANIGPLVQKAQGLGYSAKPLDSPSATWQILYSSGVLTPTGGSGNQGGICTGSSGP